MLKIYKEVPQMGCFIYLFGILAAIYVIWSHIK